MLPAYERRNMLNNNIKPLFDRVIVSSIKGVNTTSKGVIIPVVIGHNFVKEL